MKLSEYSRDHLIMWLKFRGDTLKQLNNMKEIRNRVLQYITNKTDNLIIDPTPDQKWLRKKAYCLGVKIRTQPVPCLPTVPIILKNELGVFKSLNGWSKSLHEKPIFTTEHIHKYYEKIRKQIMKTSTHVKKHFERGEQLVEEDYISPYTVYVKNTEHLYCIKGLSTASLKVENRWITLAICKETANVIYADCKCASGHLGTCSHSFALMKLFAKWVLDNKSEVPEEVACTSKPCVWSAPQGRDRIQKKAISGMTLISPESRKRKSETAQNENENPKKKSKGISSTLYDPRSSDVKNNNTIKLKKLIKELKDENVEIPFLNVVNEAKSQMYEVETSFGKMPVGSIIATQCATIPPDFKFYSTVSSSPNTNAAIFQYPPFPMHSNDDFISEDIALLPPDKHDFLNHLKIDSHTVNQIERNTVEQTNSKEWFLKRKHRFTASINYKLRIKNPKTDRGFISLAKSIVTPEKPSNILQMKLDHGKFYEPIAIQLYERYMTSINHNIQYEKCGLVVDHINFILGASPDGKVIDCTERFMYGILEVKCSEEYKDFDPKSYVHIAKNPCLELDGSDKLSLKKDHPYYDQVQMQLAITTRSWCDFIFYTLKGMAIDRVKFDPEHWDVLKNKIKTFYFRYLLNAYVNDSAE